jgi:alkanesulfonate monooxygenase SsuD/methylene tetrahydromethanopterin reductase-like flavin-dependent oxidoreductase (luciferase family)
MNNDSGTIDIWIGGQSKAALRRAARFGDGYFASFQTPAEFAANTTAIRDFAKACGREKARIESGLILRCHISSSRQRSIDEVGSILTAMSGRADPALQRCALGSARDVIDRIIEYAAVGLDKFVLWPIATPAEWPAQIERIGREIAAHFSTWRFEPAGTTA